MTKRISNKKHTGTMIKKFLNTTGFPFEMKMAKLLQKEGWTVKMSEPYLDLEALKEREIDIIANKTINDISVNLIIECKYSQKDSWIFVLAKPWISRYTTFLKSYPYIPSENATALKKCIGHLSIFNHNEPAARNFITFDGTRKSNTNPAWTALHQVIKGTIGYAAKMNSLFYRNLYFPIILFSGPIFSTTYLRSLAVKKVSYMQYPFKLNSTAYEKENYTLSTPVTISATETNHKIDDIRTAHEKLQDEYLVEFISHNKLKWYLKRIQSEVEKIDLNHWKIQKPIRKSKQS